MGDSVAQLRESFEGCVFDDGFAERGHDWELITNSPANAPRSSTSEISVVIHKETK